MRATRVIAATAVALACPDGARAAPAESAAVRAVDPAPERPAERPALLLPTRLVRATAPLRRRAASLDAALADAAQDLGLGLDVGERQSAVEQRVDEHELAALAASTRRLVVLPVLGPGEAGPEAPGDELELRLLMATPGSRSLRMRVERAPTADLPVRAAVMLRDLVTDASAPAPVAEISPARAELAVPARSSGRVILAANGTVYGGFVGYSLERVSASDDPRLLFPLMAVGAGVGLGAAIIISEEWDVGAGDAWYLAAGMWWPAVSGHLLHEGRFGDDGSDDEAWAFGLVSSAAGLTLATVGLLPHGMGEGGAALAHSGGALGLVVGGLTEFAVTGVIDQVPHAGMGYGAASGWALAAATAVHLQPDAARVLTIDLGVLLGGLGGAAAASPLLFDEPTPTKTRIWVAATGSGLVAGGIIAGLLSRPSEPSEPTADRAPSARWALPTPGVVGASEGTPGGWGVRWSGELE
jgi:hypothetical protein